MSRIEKIAAEMDSRIENVKVFFPFFKINSRSFNLEEPLDLANLSLGLLAILLEEGKLKFKGLLLDELTGFMKTYIDIAYRKDISLEDARNTTNYVLDKLQGDGENFIFPYYSSKYAGKREKMIKLVDMQVENNRILYHISKDGLDFFLKTKEFPEESQVTISLLLLRKQIQEGLFDTALQTVKNLNIQVQKRLAAKLELLSIFMNNGEDFTDRYNSFREAAKWQFAEESSYFEEINGLLNTASEEYLSKKEESKITEKEQAYLEVLREIENEIGIAVKEHRKLLNEAAILPGEIESKRRVKIRSAHGERFNFLGQLERVVKEKQPPGVLKYMIVPLLMPKGKKAFNPLKVFVSQKVSFENDEILEEDERGEKMDREYLDDIAKRRVSNNFRCFVAAVLSLLMVKKRFTLSDWHQYVKECYGEKAITSADIASFIVALNTDGKGETNSFVLKRLSSIIEEPEEINLELIFNLVLTLGPFRGLPSRLHVTPLSNEDIDLDFGIKATNLLFEGVD